MILLSSMLVKIFLVIAVSLCGYHFFSKKSCKKYFVHFCITIIAFAFLSNYISSFVPALKDTIKITALGENRAEARGQEVFLNGYTIDGKDFLAGESLEIESGHWFWSGETYAWRPETDSRQPDGVTREVILKIPVGWDRTLNFSGGIWRGLVEIDNKQDVWIEDTYTEDQSLKNIQIGRSKTSLLILNQIQYLVCYGLVLLLLSTVTIFLVQKALQSPIRAKEWLDKNNGKLIYVGIAFITFIIMFHYAGKFSFWRDELGQITFTKGTIEDAISYSLNMVNCNPPLELLFHTFWYRIAPYGEQWLLLPSMVLSCGSIFLLGILGERLKDKYCGVLSCILLAFSTTLWTNAAFEYRSYGFFIFFSTLTLYAYIRRNNANSIGWNILFSLALFCNAMIHYFGMVAMAGYFVADIYLLLKKQLKLKNFTAYVVPGLISVGWLLLVRVACGESMSNAVSWQPVPTFMHVLTLLKFLIGDMEILYWFLCAGMAISFSYIFSKNRGNFDWIRFNIIFLFVFLIGCISLIFVYGNFINQKSTMWAERYFIFLLPNSILLSVIAVSNLICALIRKIEYLNFAYKCICFFVGIVMMLNCLGLMSNSTSLSLSALGKSDTRTSEVYREAADWLYEQSNNIFNKDTIIFIPQGYNSLAGWCEYYITRQGRRDSLNVVSEYSIRNYDDILQYNQIYFQYIVRGPSSSLEKILNENYNLETDNKNVKVRAYVRK